MGQNIWHLKKTRCSLADVARTVDGTKWTTTGRLALAIGVLCASSCGEASPVVVIGEVEQLASCGRAGDTTTTLHNVGGTPLSWSGLLIGVEGATLDPPAGVIPTHSSVAVTVRIPPQPLSEPITLTLTIQSNDPKRPRIDVPIRVVRSGAVLELDKDRVDFGFMPAGVAAPPQNIVVRNTGNEAATLSSPTTDGFAIAWAEPTVAPGASVKGTVTFSSAKVGVFTDVVSVKTDNACGADPTVTLRETNVDGIVGISPGTVDLGMVGCKRNAETGGKITVFNASKQPFDVQASAVAKTIGVAVSPAVATVPGEGQVDLAVSMLDVAPDTAPLVKDYFTGAIEITTTAPKDSAHVVPVVATPKGGIVILTTTPLVDFKKRAVVAAPATLTVGVQNFGNAPVTLDASAAGAFSTAPITLAAGAAGVIGVKHTPRPDDLGHDAITSIPLSSQDPLCAPLPITLQGTSHTWEKAVWASTPRGFIANGQTFACAVGESGHAYCWGANGSGQLGSAGTASTTPRVVFSVSGVTSLATNRSTACAVTNQNEVWCWGDNETGALGTGIKGGWALPAKVAGIMDAKRVALDGAGCALRTGGGVSCWGMLGFVGDGSSYSNGAVTGPVAVSNLTDAIALDGASTEMCALKADHTIVCWGEDPRTGFGGVLFAPAHTPVAVPGAAGAYEVALSGLGACFWTGTWDRYCWGTKTDGNTAYTVGYDGLPRIHDIAASGAVRCGINANGAIECTGFDDSGLLGMGYPTYANNVIGPGTLVTLGTEYALGIDPSGALLEWGTLPNTNTIVKPRQISGFDP